MSFLWPPPSSAATAEASVDAHDGDAAAHPDLRALVAAAATKLTELTDVDTSAATVGGAHTVSQPSTGQFSLTPAMSPVAAAIIFGG